jgi:hypothetical protein
VSTRNTSSRQENPSLPCKDFFDCVNDIDKLEQALLDIEVQSAINWSWDSYQAKLVTRFVRGFNDVLEESRVYRTKGKREQFRMEKIESCVEMRVSAYELEQFEKGIIEALEKDIEKDHDDVDLYKELEKEGIVVAGLDVNKVVSERNCKSKLKRIQNCFDQVKEKFSLGSA